MYQQVLPLLSLYMQCVCACVACVKLMYIKLIYMYFKYTHILSCFILTLPLCVCVCRCGPNSEQWVKAYMLVAGERTKVMLVLRSSQNAWQLTTSTKWNRYLLFPSVLEVVCQHSFCKDNQCLCASTESHLGHFCIFPEYSSMLCRGAKAPAQFGA